MGIVISLFYSLVYFFYLEYTLAAVLDLIYSLVYLCTFAFYSSNRINLGKHYLAIAFIIQVILHSTLIFPREAYFQLYFLIAIPLIFMLFDAVEKIARHLYSLIAIIALIGIQFHQIQINYAYQFLDEQISLVSDFNLFCSFLVLSASAYIYIYQSEKKESRIRQLATTDALTGINNRRHFYDLARQQFKLSKRSGVKFSLLYVDIDNFKQINDIYGHNQGDHALTILASMMKKRTRESDLLARLGGDEFILLLADTDLNAAMTLALDIISSGMENKHADFDQPISLSIGISDFNIDDDNIETIIKRADQALYQAKESGRNQFAINPARTTQPGQINK